MRWPRVGLRLELIVASVALVVAPLAVVWSVGVAEDVIQAHVAAELDEATAELAAEAASRGLEVEAPVDQWRWLQEAAREHHVMIRVVDRRGRSLISTSPRHAERWASLRSWWMGLDDFFFGPPGPPDIESFESSLGPPSTRPEVRAALDGRRAGQWRWDDSARMMVCSTASPLDGGGAIVVTRISRRVIRSLYELRYQLLKLTLFMAAAAVMLGLYVGRRMISPLRQMQRRIKTYLRNPRREDLSALALSRRDEIGDLSRAFEELIGRLRGRADEAARAAGDLAHDLKNPIATVSATAELLEGERPMDQERRQRVARALSEAAAHMNRSVEGMLRLARLDATLAASEHERLDLVDLVEQVVERQRAAACHEEVRVTVRDDGDCRVRGDREQLEHLVINLVDNACDFARKQVLVEVRNVGEAVELRVSDDGLGVTAGNRDKVFRRFFTTRSAETNGGTGLGLSIVAAIAGAHGGEVSLLEEEGPLSGACFFVRLPFFMSNETRI